MLLHIVTPPAFLCAYNLLVYMVYCPCGRKADLDQSLRRLAKLYKLSGCFRLDAILLFCRPDVDFAQVAEWFKAVDLSYA